MSGPPSASRTMSRRAFATQSYVRASSMLTGAMFDPGDDLRSGRIDDGGSVDVEAEI